MTSREYDFTSKPILDGSGPTVRSTVFNKATYSTTGPIYRQQEIWIGCVLAIAGNLLISVSLNLQKYTHVQNSIECKDRHYTRKPVWWLGLALMGLGEIGNFSAYGFAPASLVAPLGTTTVIANMFIAVIFLKEKLRAVDLFGCTLAIIGAFLLVSFSNKNEQVTSAEQIISLLTETAFLVYMSVEIAFLVGLFVAKYKFGIENVIVLLLITSLLASFTVISAKAVSGMLQLTIAGQMQLLNAVFYIMLVIMFATAIIQVKYLNIAMKSFDATVVVPTNFVFFTISAILAGVIFYKEFWGLAAIDIFMFLFGCIMCFAGVYFITVGRAEATAPQPFEKQALIPSKPEPVDEKKLFPQILPTWLSSKLTKTEVQPKRDPHPHAVDADQVPILEQNDSLDDHKQSQSDLSLGPGNISLQTDRAAPNIYGSTDEK